IAARRSAVMPPSARTITRAQPVAGFAAILRARNLSDYRDRAEPDGTPVGAADAASAVPVTLSETSAAIAAEGRRRRFRRAAAAGGPSLLPSLPSLPSLP